MSTTATRHDVDVTNEQPRRRLSTETKSSTKTTELFVFVAMVIAYLVSRGLAKSGSHENYSA
jgi:hypothetical protein